MDIHVVMVNGVEWGHPVGAYTEEERPLKELKKAVARLSKALNDVDSYGRFEEVEIVTFRNGVLEHRWSYGQMEGVEWEKEKLDSSMVNRNAKLLSYMTKLLSYMTKHP